MTPTDIITTVARVHCVNIDELKSQRRHDPVCAARQAAMAYMRDYLGWSTPRVARYFGKKCHTTVLHASRKHRARVRNNVRSARAYDEAVRRRLDGTADQEVDVRELMGLEAFQ